MEEAAGYELPPFFLIFFSQNRGRSVQKAVFPYPPAKEIHP